MTTPLQGIFTPNIVPLDDHGQIAEDETRRYIDWLIGRGIDGLYPNGSTGEFLRFTADERQRIIEIVVDEVADRVPILAGAAEANVAETLRACGRYADLGCRAVAIVAPYYFRLDDESVYAYFAAIADESPIDVTLYHIPAFASPISVSVAKRLAETYPRIIGIKDSSGDIAHMMRMISEIRPSRPDFVFLTGWDAALRPMLAMGCRGGTNAVSGVVPELTSALYQAVQAGHAERAEYLQTRLTRVFDAMIDGLPFPEGFRAGVVLRGFATGTGRQPMSDRQRDILAQRTDVLATLIEETLADPQLQPAAI